MFIIGITGGIGCGKSAVAEICRAAGLPVIDADAISRAATAAGGAAIDELAACFGPSVIDSGGALDRQAMAALAFRNHRALDQLSAIVHRHVLAQMKEEIRILQDKKEKAVVLDVPIPVKHGFLDLCDQVWVVWADDNLRLERLRRRGMEEAEARRRMAMQMNREEYAAIADQLIMNNEGLDQLTLRVRELLAAELGQRGIRFS